jgi:hypothetical protein
MSTMLNPWILGKLGLFPIKDPEVRFVVGDPNGLSSNSWKIWQHNDSVYIACRDSFTHAKISIHPKSWRMAYTKESKLKMKGEDRTWEEWNIEKEQLPNTKIIFRLLFAKRDLVLNNELRVGEKWKNLIFIEAPPDGMFTAVSIFLTTGDIEIKHESEKSFALASFELGENKFIKVVAYGEPFGTIINEIDNTKIKIKKNLKQPSKVFPDEAYIYVFGKLPDGSRSLTGTPFNE